MLCTASLARNCSPDHHQSKSPVQDFAGRLGFSLLPRSWSAEVSVIGCPTTFALFPILPKVGKDKRFVEISRFDLLDLDPAVVAAVRFRQHYTRQPSDTVQTRYCEESLKRRRCRWPSQESGRDEDIICMQTTEDTIAACAPESEPDSAQGSAGGT